MKRLFMRTRMVLPFALVALGCILVLSGFAYAPAQTQRVERPLLSPSENCASNTTLTLFTPTNLVTVYCFAGTGFLGYRVNNVNGYRNDSGYYEWVKIYPNGSTNGCYYAIPPYGKDSGYNAYFDGNHSITQIDVNSRASFSNLCNAV